MNERTNKFFRHFSTNLPRVFVQPAIGWEAGEYHSYRQPLLKMAVEVKREWVGSMFDKVTAAAVRMAKRWVVPLSGILEMGVDHTVEVAEYLVSEQELDSHRENFVDKTIGEYTIAAVAVQVADIHYAS